MRGSRAPTALVRTAQAPMTESDPQALTPQQAAALPGTVLLEFGTDWCGHCLAARPLLREALRAHPDVRHLKIEDGPGRALGRHYGVRLWPTLVLLHDGREVARSVRPTRPAELQTLLAAPAS